MTTAPFILALLALVLLMTWYSNVILTSAIYKSGRKPTESPSNALLWISALLAALAYFLQ
jgi:flagellar biosynthesis protein FliP